LRAKEYTELISVEGKRENGLSSVEGKREYGLSSVETKTRVRAHLSWGLKRIRG
jgi:hypothetical protein